MRTVTIAGQRNGRLCTIQPPTLYLAPDEDAVESRQTEMDFRSCTARYEIGTPSRTPQAIGGGESSTTEAVSEDPTAYHSGADTAALGSTSGYFEQRWHDPPHATVNSDRSTISWSYDGVCVTSSSGSALLVLVVEHGMEQESHPMCTSIDRNVTTITSTLARTSIMDFSVGRGLRSMSTTIELLSLATPLGG